MQVRLKNQEDGKDKPEMLQIVYGDIVQEWQESDILFCCAYKYILIGHANPLFEPG